jgi:hypothetical protein
LYKANEDTNYEEFVRTDCQFFDPQVDKVEDYFGKRNEIYNTNGMNLKELNSPERNVKNKNKLDETSGKNTSRELKDREDKTNNLNLYSKYMRQNSSIELQEHHIIDTPVTDNKLVMKENEGVGTDNVVLQNNFVDSQNCDPVKAVNINSQKEMIKNKITLRDYACLNPCYVPKYDLRTVGAYVKDEVFTKHRLLTVLKKRSILDPVIIRSTKLIFHLSSCLASSALLFTDDYIELKLRNSMKVLIYFTFSITMAICLPMNSQS